MQGDFEKKVQAKMEELQLTPSVPVWEKIELQIKPEKKRRRVLAWLFLASLLGGGAWFLAVQKPGEPATSAALPKAAAPSTAPARKTPSLQQEVIAAKDHHPFGAPSITPDQAQPKPLSSMGSHQKQQPTALRTAKPFPTKPSMERETVPVSNNAIPLQTSVAPSLQEQDGVAVQPLVATAERKTEEVKESVPVDSAAQVLDSAGKQVPAADSAGKTKKIAAVRKWQKQLFLQGGWSHFPMTSVPGSGAAYSSYNPGNSIGAPSVVKNEKGGAIAAGIGVSTEWKRGVQFSIGVQYAAYTIRSQAGVFRGIDTTVTYDNSQTMVRGYYSNNQVSGYTVRLHLLELPVSLGFAPSAAVPLQVLVGASYGRLLHSNALTYLSPYGNAYYNKANNRKDQFHVFAGLQYRLFQKTAWALSVGPQVQYGVTSLQKEYVSKEPHLFFAGLKTALRF